MEQVTPSQAKKYLKQLKQRQEQYLYYLGQLAFRAGEEGRLPEGPMAEAYQTLKNIQEQVKGWEAYLQGLRVAREAAQLSRCPRCGASLPRGTAVCPYCGTALAAPAPAAAATLPYGVPVTPQAGAIPSGAPTPQVATPAPPAGWEAPAAPVPPAGKTCPGCGTILEADAIFCGSCGRRVAGEAAPGPGKPAAGAASPQVSSLPAEPPRQEEAAPAVNCPGCGNAVSDEEARFCPNCGTRVRQ